MNNQFSLYFSTHHALPFILSRFAGEQHWRSAL